MCGYFSTWRRKIGVGTLLIACVFMAAWVRSLTIGDQSTIRMGHESLFWMISNNGWFGCVAIVESKAGSAAPFFLHWTDRSSPRNRNMGPFEGIPYSWNWETSPHVILPYSTMVVPLTLISIWLLLSKPAESIQKKIAKPVSTE